MLHRGGWLVVVLVAAAGCGSSYRTVRQSAGDSGALRAARAIAVAPIEFRVPPPESPEEWAGHLAAWNAAYGEELVRQAGAGGPPVQLLGPGEPAPGGVVVVAVVSDIRRGNYMSGDHLVVDVDLLDAASRAPHLRATLDVSSFRATGGPEGYTFGGRIKFAVRNLAEAIAGALRSGTFQR